MYLVGVVGALTLLMAGFSALAQTDIKRILAYSTMSQIGYMFLALGVGAFDAAIFHLMTHAFFKALLFLSAGSVIIATHHEQDIFRLGGLRKSLPLVYACFLVGGAALAALPFITAGFYSKDAILWQDLAADKPEFVIAGLIGALLTSLYIFRLIFTVFHGKEQVHAHADRSVTQVVPLIILAILSTKVGALIHPPLAGLFPPSPGTGLEEGKHLLELISIAVACSGVVIAYLLFAGDRVFISRVASGTIGKFFAGLWKQAWGFDLLYETLFVKPFRAIIARSKRDLADYVAELFIPALLHTLRNPLVAAQNGQVRWYMATMALGVALLLTFVLFT
jgi:NADH-quinone oxidoreductase subunit L